MRKFICIKSNPYCKVGQLMFAGDVGEPLFFARMDGTKLRQTSKIPIEFPVLSMHIVELGFEISLRSKATERLDGEIKEITDFQREYEDIIEEELLRRNKEAESDKHD